MKKVKRTIRPTFKQIENMAYNLSEKLDMSVFVSFEAVRHVFRDKKLPIEEKFEIAVVKQDGNCELITRKAWERLQNEYFNLMEHGL